jgi:hypothetical protein
MIRIEAAQSPLNCCEKRIVQACMPVCDCTLGCMIFVYLGYEKVYKYFYGNQNK